MNRLYKFLMLVPGVLLLACTTKPNQQPQQVESDSATVALSDHPITDRLYAELDSSEVYNDSILYGYWFKPHEACAVNIFFHKDNTYEFKNYEVDKDDNIIDISEKGKYTKKGDVITLDSSDGYFKSVILYKYDGTNHYLTDDKGELYLIKGSD